MKTAEQVFKMIERSPVKKLVSLDEEIQIQYEEVIQWLKVTNDQIQNWTYNFARDIKKSFKMYLKEIKFFN